MGGARPGLVSLLVAVLGALGNTGCVYARIVYFNFPTLSAPSYFDNRPVHASSHPIPLATSSEPDPVFRLTPPDASKYSSFDDFLERNDTVAFLAVRDDRIVYERYFGGVSAATVLPDFSISKTVAALLVGCALSDGLLESVDRTLVSYAPELQSKRGYGEITIDELLRMTAGLDFSEESVGGASLYYTTELRPYIYSYDVKWAPGTHYLYGSLSTEILWDVLRRRLGGQTISHYFEERLWGPLGAEHDASWSLDSASSGVEKFFGGFNATARDHARFGLLFLHGGSLGGRRILSEGFVRRSLEPDAVAGTVHTSDGSVRRAKYEWFLTADGRAYFAKGYRGQYVFVVPEKRMVFVRFGKGYGEVNWPAQFLRLADAMPCDARAAL
jgi:CubicO group peptidase (beta-lactamase class C family)